jgi:hypothetical protein
MCAPCITQISPLLHGNNNRLQFSVGFLHPEIICLKFKIRELDICKKQQRLLSLVFPRDTSSQQWVVHVCDLQWHDFDLIKKFETDFSKECALVTFRTKFDLLRFEICWIFVDNCSLTCMYFKLEYNRDFL